MTWLITGGAGYIGAHVVREFRDAGLPVVVLDDLSTGVRDRVPADVPFVQGTILEATLLDRTLAEHLITGVVHIAGKKSVSESVVHPEYYQTQNVDGTGALLAACERHAVRHFVFSSSAAVYGVIDSAEPIDEDAPTVPINPYGQSKLDAERLVEKATTAGAMDAVAFRYFNVGGATEPLLEDVIGENLIPIVRRAIASGTPVRVFGTQLPTRDGSCIRDYIHVADLASAHLDAAMYLERGAQRGFEVINLGTGTGSTVLEVIAAISRAEQTDVSWVAADPRVGDPVASTCDARRAGARLGWQATHSLDDIVTRAP